ncbi:hypothetical protein [Actinacidiphila sp. ITFR-21]|uniref:hypothetical protein n=1 Tax=Actinacidiphila sp. ITFR-21 TaxID=3075199 RepID=UPI00288A8BF1|nr:hypothetical protein [Streptomyces sp. ITFR-21]WNI16928.1 hypothetical protein RLT57_16290 [Streptomyces sp. ITFR-21]
MTTSPPVPGPLPAGGRPLTLAQAIILGVTAAGILAIGAAGAYGTYTNLGAAFHRSGTALGAVAGGEGATLILSGAYVALIMLGQTAPRTVRVALWLLPTAAAVIGATVAQGAAQTAVYAISSVAMCVAAEGCGLIARRIVIRTSGVDVEARRRTAETTRRLAYEWAVAAHHPDLKERRSAERRAWKLARRVGADDMELGDGLVTVQRARTIQSADTALGAMYGLTVPPTVTPGTPTVPAPVPGVPGSLEGPAAPALEAAPEPEAGTVGGTVGGAGVPDAVTQASTPGPAQPDEAGTPAGTPTVPDHVPAVPAVPAVPVPVPVPVPGVTLAELALVAGVPVPVPGEALDDEQLAVVLRWLRHHDDPPLSYRQAKTVFREHGFVGSEERVRRSWGAVLSREEETGTAADDGITG